MLRDNDTSHGSGLDGYGLDSGKTMDAPSSDMPAPRQIKAAHAERQEMLYPSDRHRVSGMRR